MYLVAEGEREPWNHLVEQSPTGSLPQMWEWSCLHQLGPMFRLAVADDDGAYLACAVMLEQQVPVSHQKLLYVPRGPVCDDPASPALALLVEGMRDLARRRQCFAMRVEPHVAHDDHAWRNALRGLSFQPNRYAIFPRRSWILDIHPAQDKLLAGMNKTCRYSIKRAQREGVQIRQGISERDRADFYAIYQETAQRHGFAIFPRAHYDEVLEAFLPQGKGMLFLADYGGKPIAAAVITVCGTVATYLYGASADHERQVMPNHLIQWTAIQWAKAQGCTYYDFRAVAENLTPTDDLYGLYIFKHGFGGASEFCLESYDLAINPAVYRLYRWGVHLKRTYHDYRRQRRLTAASE
ncbi:MAG TPA: peptidoglycan bridge formation glycyltransferase FemA/FemB family protein [Ktedonobacterales bacterium]|nr:peptidoglycan bridge formation glycyltransferase FemA/FemB family protein [Ktedonobacterales bacterium]